MDTYDKLRQDLTKKLSEAFIREEKLQAKITRLNEITGLLCSGCDTEIKDELSGCKHLFCNKCLDKIEQALQGQKGEE